MSCLWWSYWGLANKVLDREKYENTWYKTLGEREKMILFHSWTVIGSTESLRIRTWYFKITMLFYFVCTNVLPTCMCICTMYVPGTLGSEEDTGSQELEFWMFVSHYVKCWGVHPSFKSNKYSLTLELSLQGSGLNFSTLIQFIGQLASSRTCSTWIAWKEKGMQAFWEISRKHCKQFHAAWYNIEIIYDVDSLLQSLFLLWILADAFLWKL